jgi:MoxR-like ATPase
MDPKNVNEIVLRLREEIHRIVVGQERAVDLLLVALLSEGHVLLEGVPGTAKTLLAQSFAACLDLGFKRVQFTPDLMPADVTGTSLFNFQTGQFALSKGPLFTDVLLADEINRTPPKTQAALLQAMQERSVTLDGVTHDLGSSFMVIATQNPIEHEGTYPLPEAQLDRFLVKIRIGIPSRDELRQMVRLHGHHTAMPKLDEYHLSKVADRTTLADVRRIVAAIRLSDDVADYVVDLVHATQHHPSISLGASPRAANMLAVASRAAAILAGRDFVIPDDVKGLAQPVLAHRLVLAPGTDLDGTTAENLLDQIVAERAAPR